MPLLTASRAFVLSAVFLFLLVSGCRDVRLISEYDEETDRAATALHKQVEALLIRIERNPDAPADDFDAAYSDVLAGLRVLQLRAASRPKNGIQEAQLAEIENQMVLLEEAHREGISAAEIPIFRNGFAQSFRAVLTLELAKKRGEKSP